MEVSLRVVKMDKQVLGWDGMCLKVGFDQGGEKKPKKS